MSKQRRKYGNQVTGSKGVLIGDRVRVGSLTFHEAQTLSDEATYYAQVGLSHLERRCYGAAAQALQKSIERAPGDALLHYRLALALLAGCRPKDLGPRQIAPIERALTEALGLHPPDGRPALLLAFVRYDHYVLNHRRPPGPNLAELLYTGFQAGLSIEQYEEIGSHTDWRHFIEKICKLEAL